MAWTADPSAQVGIGVGDPDANTPKRRALREHSWPKSFIDPRGAQIDAVSRYGSQTLSPKAR